MVEGELWLAVSAPVTQVLHSTGSHITPSHIKYIHLLLSKLLVYTAQPSVLPSNYIHSLI